MSLILVGCGDGTGEDPKNPLAPSWCDKNLIHTLNDLQVRDRTDGLTPDQPNIQRVLSECPAQDSSSYRSDHYCSKSVTYYRFKDVTFEWDYYYDIDFDCSDDRIITSIYLGH